MLNHVNYIYDEDTAMASAALIDVSLKIPDGQFIGLIGHTGSGKSTLIQHMNGLVKPSSGQVFFDNEDINEKDYDKKKLRAKVGLVFQYPEHQLFEADCFKDVCFGPKNLGLPQKEVELRAYEALKQVGFDDDYFYQSPFDLSGGQKRRVAIAGVLAMRPELLILDEPTAGLDPKGHDDILEMIRRIRHELDMSIILVSHNMDDVAEYADRVLVMNRGTMMFLGTPREVYCEHEDELREIGLDIPSCPSFLWLLKNRGMDVDDNKLEFEETAEEIIRAVKKRWQ